MKTNRELWAAFITIILITLLYLGVVIWRGSIPAASEFFGHGLGVAGFLLMLMTETLYSLRKRQRMAGWGRMASWLEFHIYTGLVGPYMVLLHSAWKLNGLAGVTLLLTAVVVASGFVGRYIYTAVPRTVDGVEVQAEVLRGSIQAVQAAIGSWMAEQTVSPRLLKIGEKMAALTSAGGSGFIWQRGLLGWRTRWEWFKLRRGMSGLARQKAEQLEALVWQRQELQGQLASLASARKMLAIWHVVHIPIGMVLFMAAFIHILAAVYYATLLRLWD